MTTEAQKTNPLVNRLQQDLYSGTEGDATAGEGAEQAPAPCGSWAFQYDPAEPNRMTMLVTLEATQTPPQTSNGSAPGCLSFYSSRLAVADVSSLYQWLALQMGKQMAASSKKSSAKGDTSKDQGSAQ
jgi:hypothetical protein